MGRELKKYELRATKKPARSDLVSTTVAIRGEDNSRYYCYISFSQAFVEAVGRALPRGVTIYEPAYLFVDCTKAGFDVWACYATDTEKVKMWSVPAERGAPAWLNFYKVQR